MKYTFNSQSVCTTNSKISFNNGWFRMCFSVELIASSTERN